MNTKDHEIFDDLCAMHAFGALDGEDIKLFEKHIQEGCSLCDEHLREYVNTLEALPLSSAAPKPAPALRQRIENITRVREIRRFRIFMAAAGLLLTLLATFVALRPEADLGRILRQPAVLLEGRDLHCASCRMNVHWVPGTTQVVVASDHVCHCPPGKIYQLWYIVDKKPRPAAVFNSDSQGKLQARADLGQAMASVEGFAVTIEEQWRPAPQGEIVMASK